MCAMSGMQCAGVRPWNAVPWRKTYPCQNEEDTKDKYLIIWPRQLLHESDTEIFSCMCVCNIQLPISAEASFPRLLRLTHTS
jgi:hypothetical protein